jgi:NADH:ubiquinone oxidoreductase subunit 3 (subunit A)
MIPVGEGNPRMSAKFNLVVKLFILFGIEDVFFPWAVV